MTPHPQKKEKEKKSIFPLKCALGPHPSPYMVPFESYLFGQFTTSGPYPPSECF